MHGGLVNTRMAGLQPTSFSFPRFAVELKNKQTNKKVEPKNKQTKNQIPNKFLGMLMIDTGPTIHEEIVAS